MKCLIRIVVILISVCVLTKSQNFSSSLDLDINDDLMIETISNGTGKLSSEDERY